MHFIRIALAVLSAHFSAVQAYQFSTAQICTTKYGTKSVSVKTTSYAITIPITVVNKFTTTPTITITPAPQTTTSTTTTTVNIRLICFKSLGLTTLMVLGHLDRGHNPNEYFHRDYVHNVHCKSCILNIVIRWCHGCPYSLTPTRLPQRQP